VAFEKLFDEGNIIVWDNGGETMDRFSILVDKEFIFSMSNNPLSCMGFNQYAGNINECDAYEDVDDFIRQWDEKETRLSIEEIPDGVKKAILKRMGGY